MAISSQWWKLARMDACVSGSAARKFPIVWSEKTTPQPKVSSGRFRSYTSMRTDGNALRSRMAEYSPAGPPPRHTIRLIPAVPLVQWPKVACGAFDTGPERRDFHSPLDNHIASTLRMLYCQVLQVSIILSPIFRENS